MAEGVTTIEVKSGYGLSLEHEARCLRVARRLGAELPLTLKTTCLAAHAVPPEFDGRADDYIDAVCGWLPVLHAEGLIDAVDAFCDTIAFTPAQTRRVFDAAQRARAAGQAARRTAQRPGRRRARRRLRRAQLRPPRMAVAPTASPRWRGAAASRCCCPARSTSCARRRLPPVQALRDAGVPIAIASDHNPGSSPGLSLLLMLNMACTLFRLTPEEALRGATVHGARALGLHDRGRLAAGQRADFVVWALDHPAELAYWFGHNPCRRVVVGGSERRSA